jgi:hypothetical protein
MPFSDDYTDSDTDSTTDESDESEPSTSDLEFIDDDGCSSDSGSESDAEITLEETIVSQSELDFIRQAACELVSPVSGPESGTASGTEDSSDPCDPTEVQEEVADEGSEYDSCEEGESDELYTGGEEDTDESEEGSDAGEDEMESDVGSDEGEDGTVGDTDDEETDGGPDEEDDADDTEASGSPRLPLKRPRAALGDGHARFKRALVSLIKEAL